MHTYKSKALVSSLLLSFILLEGCISNNEEQAPVTQKVDLTGPFSVPPSEILLPLASERLIEQDQAIIVKLSMMLDTQAKTKGDRAEIFYELGIVYDRLGLEATARTMFMNALVESPTFAAPYNFVGIYFAKDGRFQDALDAFDSALELNPKESYIYFNRAIVLHYAHRDVLTLDDLLTFYKSDPNDPYRLLWMYIVERGALGADKALSNLEERYDKVRELDKKDNWGFNLVRLYLGTLDKSTFWKQIKAYRQDSETYVDHLCEAYFYLGKLHLLNGEDKAAYDNFYLSAATRRYGFLEYRYALEEIDTLEKRYKLRATSSMIEPRF